MISFIIIITIIRVTKLQIYSSCDKIDRVYINKEIRVVSGSSIHDNGVNIYSFASVSLCSMNECRRTNPFTLSTLGWGPSDRGFWYQIGDMMRRVRDWNCPSIDEGETWGMTEGNIDREKGTRSSHWSNDQTILTTLMVKIKTLVKSTKKRLSELHRKSGF